MPKTPPHRAPLFLAILLALPALTLAGATTSPSTRPSSDLVELKAQISLPPVPISRVVNIPQDAERPRDQKLMVPRGTVLLSRKKPVTCSDKEPIIGRVEQVTDGEKRWQDESLFEIAPGAQWVQIDLGQTSRISAVNIWHDPYSFEVYHDVVVQLSDDATFKTSTIIFNNDDDNSLGLGRGRDREYVEMPEGKLIDGKSTPARYVRLWTNNTRNDKYNRYYEVEIFGLPPAP